MTTMAELRALWQEAAGLLTSVAFFAGDRYLRDGLTVGQALTAAPTRTLELTAVRKWRLGLEVFGFEETQTQFQVVPSLTPADVRQEIRDVLGIHTEDFRIMWGQRELDQEVPFNEQGLIELEDLVVDLRVIAVVRFPDEERMQRIECFASESIGDLRGSVDFGDNDRALVLTSPVRHVLHDNMRLTEILYDPFDLEVPVELIAEEKILLHFEPIGLEHLRKSIPIAISSTPCDLYAHLSEVFGLRTEYRLSVQGQELDNCQSLSSQLIDLDDIIQLDILRPCCVRDLWKAEDDELVREMVFLYSTESAYALFMRDELSGQRLYHEGIKLTIFGSMIDVFGPVSGGGKPLILVDREVERSYPVITFNTIERKMGWANDLLLNVVPTSGCLVPKEIMFNGRLLSGQSLLKDLPEGSLLVTDPKKVFVGKDKKFRLCRFARDATFGDARERVRQMFGQFDVGLKSKAGDIGEEVMQRQMDREILFVTHAERFKTKLIVTLGDKWYPCCFLPEQVKFSDVMIDVGKQADILPRQLFSKALYCRGCGRKVSQEEEADQNIPSGCCKVRSLNLTDRCVTSKEGEEGQSCRATPTQRPSSRSYSCV